MLEDFSIGRPVFYFYFLGPLAAKLEKD